jgi:predicted oxidoreductase
MPNTQGSQARGTGTQGVGSGTSDVLVIGAGLSGLVAATEACDAGATVTLIDQESEANLGGQAYWSFGGLFLVDSPEQRRMGIRDSLDLAHRDWWGSAQFEDHDAFPRQWAEAYLEFAAGPKREWLHTMGVRFFPVVGWAERGDGTAHGHGNSVPRFHITWGTGPGVLAPFVARAKDHIRAGRLRVHFGHRPGDGGRAGDRGLGRGVGERPCGARRGELT